MRSRVAVALQDSEWGAILTRNLRWNPQALIPCTINKASTLLCRVSERCPNERPTEALYVDAVMLIEIERWTIENDFADPSNSRNEAKQENLRTMGASTVRMNEIIFSEYLENARDMEEIDEATAAADAAPDVTYNE